MSIKKNWLNKKDNIKINVCNSKKNNKRNYNTYRSLYFIKRELKESNPQVVEFENNCFVFRVFLAQTND